MANVLDTYTRGDSATPGTTDSGQAYTVLRGSVPIRAGRAFPAAPNSLAVVDAGVGGQDAAVSIATGAGGGHALYLRVVDVNNWWRASQRHYSYTYQSGTQQVFSHNEQRQVGTEQVIVGYNTVQTGSQSVYVGDEYSAFMTYRHTYAGNSGSAGQLVSNGTPGFVAPYNERHYNAAPAYSYPAVSTWPDIFVSANSVMRAYDYARDPIKPIYQTQPVYEQQPIYETRPVYQTVPVFVTQPVYATAYAYEVRLEKCVGGTITPVIAKNVGAAAPSSLRVTAQGSTLTLYSSVDADAHGSVTDGAHAAATRHGIGHAETSELGNTSGIDEFRVAPYNTPPGLPTLLAPIGNEVVRAAEAQTFRLRPADTDPGDVISRTDWEWQLVSGGTVITHTQNTAEAQTTRAANAFTSGAWQWRARTYDRAGAVGSWSGWAYFTAGVPQPAPTITSPTNNAVISDTSGPVSWSASQQEAYEVRVLGDSGGTPNLAVVYVPAVTVVSDARTTTVTRAQSGRVEHTQVRTRYLGLWSEWGSSRNEVLFTPPAVAFLALALDARRGYVLATIQHPTPIGSQPEVQYAELWRRRVGQVRETRIATNLGAGTVVDARVQHRTDYEYRVVTVGANGGRSSTLWITTSSGGGQEQVRPAAPVMQVPATEVSRSGFRSSWQPVAGAVDYVVQRLEVGTSAWSTVGVVAETTYLHTGLIASGNYDVRVIARAASGLTSDPSMPVRTSTSAVPLTSVTATRTTTWAARRPVATGRASTWQVIGTSLSDPSRFPYSSTSPWKLGIAQAATFEAESATITADLLDNGVPGDGKVWINYRDWSHDLIRSTTSDPLKTVTDTNDGSRSRTYRIPLTARPSVGADAHMHILDPDGKTLHEAFGVSIQNAGTTAAVYTAARVETSDLTSDGLGPKAGTRAYGGGAIGGLIRREEVDPSSPYFTADPRYPGQNVPLIRHALAIALRADQLYWRASVNTQYFTGGVTNATDQPGWPVGRSLAGFMGRFGYVWPATEQDDNGQWSYTGTVPMGTYFAIPPGATMPASSSATAAGKAIWHAMQDYGVYVTDRSGAMNLYMEYSPAGTAPASDAFVNDLLGGNSYSALPIRGAIAASRRVLNNNHANPNGGPLGAARRGGTVVDVGTPPPPPVPDPPAGGNKVAGFVSTMTDATGWVLSGFSITGGQMVRPAEPLGSFAYGSADSAARYDGTSSSVHIELVEAIRGGYSCETAFEVRGDADNLLAFLVEGDNGNPALNFRARTNGANSNGGGLTYVPASHRWLRFLESAGTVTFQTSPDKVTWTDRRSIPTPAWYTSLTVGPSSGNYSPTVQATGTARFDNLNA